MTTLIDIYISNKDFFIEKKLQNIIAMCGDGKLRDKSTASDQFREFLKMIPSELLIKYCYECLNDSFLDSGIALQDVINQMGIRLNYEVEHGLYQGKRNAVGFDGIWKGKDGHSLIIESKTTDAYRINLDTLGTYRQKLIEHGVVSESASILIIVGRQDTGDLEAQIRGSKHAWDIRVISTDAIIDLMNMRATVDDVKILQQINEVLKPLEYTRLDKLVKLLYLTSKDQIEDDSPTETDDIASVAIDQEEKAIKKAPMNYHDQCVEKLSQILNKSFVKQSKSMYTSLDKNIGISISVSKAYISGNTISYWYAYHPYQDDFLNDCENGFACFSCGTADSIIIIPINVFTEMKDNFTFTLKGEKKYWHVWIYKTSNGFELGQSKNPINKRINLDKYINRVN